jgi:MFS transporter, ACS family, hexuronate transporter
MTERHIPNLRWYIASLLCLSSALNYLDRQTLSVLADTIQRELKLTTVDYSYITSSFLVSYTIMYAVSGRLIDVLGSRRSFLIFVSGWSVANMLHALATTALRFSFFRFLLGATEPANFPAGVRAVTEWFPMRERALAVGIFNAGTAVGAALAVPIVSFIALEWGWRWAFVVTGATGFIWVAVWAGFYHLPHEHPRLSPAEKELILSGSEAPLEGPARPVPLGRLLAMRVTWGCILARVLTDPISYFLNFWIPKYLQQERGFSLSDLGKYIWIPFVALALGNVASGAIPRYLISRGWSLNRARKTTMFVVSCLVPIVCLSITRVPTAAMATALVTALMFLHAAWGNITIPAEVFPKHVVGSVSGFGGALGGVAGVITQLAIGWVVQHLSFAPIFAAMSVAYLLGFAAVHLLVGELGTICEIPPATNPERA